MNREDELAGMALVALSISQMCFWYLVREGLATKEEAVRTLEAAAQGMRGEHAGHANNFASMTLDSFLQNVRGWQPLMMKPLDARPK